MRPWLALILLLPTAAASPLIVGIVPQMPGGGDGGVAVASDSPMDLTGFQLTDGEGTWTFPAGTRLEAGTPLWVVSEPAAWNSHQGAEPSVPMANGALSGTLKLADSGDSVALRDAAGVEIDAMAWGSQTAETTGKLSASSPGLIFQRDKVQGAWVDSGNAADWVTPRMHRIGESNLDSPSFVVNRLTLYASPDSSFQTLTQLIGQATQRIHLHVYQLRSIALIDSLVAAKEAHPSLDLRVFVDDNPVGMTLPDRHATADALQRIVDSGGHATLANNGRYDDFHLKVLIVDDAVAVQSENWVETGVPVDPSFGNRGWGAVVWDAACTQWFAEWMAQDRAAWDARPFNRTDFDPTFEAPLRKTPRSGEYGPIQGAKTLEGTFTVKPLVAPDHTQDPRSDALAAIIDSATARIDVQQLDLSIRAANSLGWSSPDPLLESLAAASNRGASVRLIAAMPFASEPGNRVEIASLQAAAPAAQGVLIDREGIETMHNKGFVADDVVVLGSMNGNHHSRSANREVDLVLTGPGVAAYYQGLFEGDWGGQERPGNWAVIGEDLKGLPAAPFPMLLVVLGVASLVARTRP